MAKRIIGKYKIPIGHDCQTEQGCWDPKLILPTGAKILSIGAQGEQLVLWALVDPEFDQTEEVGLLVLFTGVSIPESVLDEGFEFLGTVQTHPADAGEGPPLFELVFHVYKAPSSSG